MRRTALLSARTLLVLLFLAAILDLPIPSASRARRRLHLVDRSESVRVPGAPESLTLEDAGRLVEWDRTLSRTGDEVSWASFGRDVAFDSENVDGRTTDLAAALQAALARDPTEIVLHSDGRADPGAALFLCRERGIPVHAVPLGPAGVRDARIARVSAPADLPPGGRFTLEVTVESTFETPARLRVESDVKEIRLAPGAPALASFRDRPAGPFKVRLELEDACGRNNTAEGAVYERSSRRKILILGSRPIAMPEFDVRVSASFEDPFPYAAVVLDDARPDERELGALARYVRGGGGLLLLGGPSGFPLDWKGTPLEELSPLKFSPEERVAVLFAVDNSGSMDAPGRLDAVLAAVKDAWRLLEPGDDVAAMPMVGPRFITDPGGLGAIRAGGPTDIGGAIAAGRRHLESRDGRKHLVLLTDGEPGKEEKPEQRLQEKDLLLRAGIGLTVVTTGKRIEFGIHVAVNDWIALAGEMRKIVAGLRERERPNPGPLDLREHAVTEGVARVELPRMNLRAAKTGAIVAATVGRPPAVYPAAAFHAVGGGRVGALAFAHDPAVDRLVRQSVEYVSGGASGGFALVIDPPVVRARGQGPPVLEALLQSAEGPRPLALRQVRSDLWEGTLPPLAPGAVQVRLPGGAAASATILDGEYSAFGPDFRTLERICALTGGRLLRSTGDLEGLPRPKRPAPVGGRPWFAAAALLALFLDLALSTFWKP